MGEKFLDHHDRASVMFTHELEEMPIELDRLRLLETAHLLCRQHARHQDRAMRVMRVHGGDFLAVRAQLFLHHLDLVFLRDLDAFRELVHDGHVSLREARSSVISRAWAWWEIIPCMKRTSASEN